MKPPNIRHLPPTAYRLPPRRGFTLIELLLVVAIIGLLASIIAVGGGNAKAKRRDVKRVSDIVELQKALALYLAKVQTYPTLVGCVDGTPTDVVTSGLIANSFITPSAKLSDPTYPSDTSKCFFYNGGAGKYTLRYTLEATSTAGEAGDHLVVP